MTRNDDELINAQIGEVERSARYTDRGSECILTVELTQDYRAEAADVWDALTSPERLARWFGNVSGDFERGGRFQIEGNASGTITRCTPPRELAVTWEFGGDTSAVTATVSPRAAGVTRLTIAHAGPGGNKHAQTYGPAAGGVGWDLALLGLVLHLKHGVVLDDAREEWAQTEQARAFIADSGRRWAAADVADGTPRACAEDRAAATVAFFTGAEEAS